jgi:hypothetical protein
MQIIKDGNKYMVCGDGFKNLQESDNYFFITETEYEEWNQKIRETLLADIARLNEYHPSCYPHATCPFLSKDDVTGLINQLTNK